MKKKFLITMVIVVIMLAITATAVNATSQTITMTGDSSIMVGETKVIKLKVSSQNAIGIISGKIEKNNLISSMSVSALNGWNLTYNSSTGIFNIYKAEGATNEEFISIQYTVGNTIGTGVITLSNLKATNTSYETEEIGTITKEITINEPLTISFGTYLQVTKNGQTYIEDIKPVITIGNFLQRLQSNGLIEIFKGTQNLTNSTTTKLATGMTIKNTLNTQVANYTVVVTGDLNGDGEMNDIDVLKLARYKAGLDTNLTGAYLEAGNIFRDSACADDKDLLKMVRVLVGLDTL